MPPHQEDSTQKWRDSRGAGHRAAELLGATRTACLTALVPVVAVLLSVLVLAEPLGLAKLAGVTLAVGGMLAAVVFTGRRSR